MQIILRRFTRRALAKSAKCFWKYISFNNYFCKILIFSGLLDLKIKYFRAAA